MRAMGGASHLGRQFLIGLPCVRRSPRAGSNQQIAEPDKRVRRRLSRVRADLKPAGAAVGKNMLRAAFLHGGKEIRPDSRGHIVFFFFKTVASGNAAATGPRVFNADAGDDVSQERKARRAAPLRAEVAGRMVDRKSVV